MEVITFTGIKKKMGSLILLFQLGLLMTSCTSPKANNSYNAKELERYTTIIQNAYSLEYAFNANLPYISSGDTAIYELNGNLLIVPISEVNEWFEHQTQLFPLKKDEYLTETFTFYKLEYHSEAMFDWSVQASYSLKSESLDKLLYLGTGWIDFQAKPDPPKAVKNAKLDVLLLYLRDALNEIDILEPANVHVGYYADRGLYSYFIAAVEIGSSCYFGEYYVQETEDGLKAGTCNIDGRAFLNLKMISLTEEMYIDNPGYSRVIDNIILLSTYQTAI